MPNPFRPDPSRNLPICINCKYHEQRKIRRSDQTKTIALHLCNHPSTPVDEVNGTPLMTCDRARNNSNDVFCGTEGKLFEAATLQQIPQPAGFAV